MHIAVTGASGYIGRRFIEVASKEGHHITSVGRSAVVSSDTSFDHIDWHFSAPLVKTVFSGKCIDAVVHLGHDWDEEEKNAVATRALLEATKCAHIPTFVFGSSIVARKSAPNHYGRIKREIEEYCARHGAIVARIGLVYGGPLKATWGRLNRIIKFLPVVPMVGRKSLVYPIHLDDVARCLLKLATGSALGRQEPIVLAHQSGITFASFLRDVSFILHRKKLFLFPVPVNLILAAIKLLRLLNCPPIVDPERILGLSSMRPTMLPLDLSETGFPLQDFRGALWREEAALYEERLNEEAFVMLRYAGGKRPSAASTKAYYEYVRVSEMPWPIFKLPFWLLALTGPRCFEPIGLARNLEVREFKRRLIVASIIEEQTMKRLQKSRKQCGVLRGIYVVMFQVIVEILLLPVRAALGRFLV